MQLRYSMALGAAAALGSPAFAAGLQLKLELPRLAVAEYHRPYVAVWLERADQSALTNLAVWYDLKLKGGDGTKWLKDLRAWWRKSGRELSMPVDGLTGATRAPGEHTLGFGAGRAPLERLAPGDYTLVVEAARENGGRELLRLPFRWPAIAPQTLKAQGEHELGAVSLELQP